MPDFLYSFNEDVMSNPSNEHFRLHSHSEYEIYMFLSGDSKYVVEGKNYELSHGDIIIIRKHEMHRVFHNSNKEYHRLVIMISPDFFKKYHCEEFENAFWDKKNRIGNRISAHIVRSSGLYDAIMRLKKYSDNFTLPHTAIVDSIMVEILYLINGISTFESADTSNKTIKNVINYINNNFTDEITLELLCEQFYVSKYHLCRIFKEVTGLTVQGYIRQKRLTLVTELKKEGKTLTEAALTAGFKNYSSFYRAYLNRYNASPNQSPLIRKSNHSMLHN